nr:immunoglobulin heavy chain junction region [Macaca mulatta]MOX59882.1 immunoglobulin heavy chain junction region [Macaca mulatta]MOX60086.1 immunoglobulin heavy chain junction region [Macaca mulatta]MOX60215.1 immunoglobulin heavy chain junction region [Macaca mulatta]MOX61032.1 immunoglobulin heavy chain junction region [Macaca mulatta]
CATADYGNSLDYW